jgi:hypothetical protein
VEALRLSRANGSEAHMIYVEENITWNAPEAEGRKRTLDRKFAELVAKAEAEAKLQGVKLMSHMGAQPRPLPTSFSRGTGSISS